MKIFDISLYNGVYKDFLNVILTNKSKTLVFTPNPEILYRAYFDEEFMQILKSATYNVPDGNWLYVAEMMSEWKNFFTSCFGVFFDKKNIYKKYWELIKGSDLTKNILENWAIIKQKILIIDRKNEKPKNDFEIKKSEIQKNMAKILEEKFVWNEIFVVFDGEKTPEEIAKIIQKNNINFVFSCIGMKKQEEILVKIFDFLPNNFAVAGFGVGASIDFLLGLQKRAPKIFAENGLEWLYRLITQPKIRYKRIKTALIDFPILVKKSLKNFENKK